MKSITDRAEVSVDFPDKTYMGAFGGESSFDVKVEADEVLLRIVRSGAERREIAVHLHYYLLADILKELGQGLAKDCKLDEVASPRPARRREGVGAGAAEPRLKQRLIISYEVGALRRPLRRQHRHSASGGGVVASSSPRRRAPRPW